MRVQKESTLNAYTAWYPPVQQTLLCLSKMYRCIDARIFGGLAQEAVSAATATAQAASRLVAKRAKPSRSCQLAVPQPHTPECVYAQRFGAEVQFFHPGSQPYIIARSNSDFW